MKREIRKVAVLGSGVMGSAIAAHLANAGIPSILLDIVPKAADPAEEKAGLTLESKAVRNRFARVALESAVKAKPAPFFDPSLASLIEIGNFDDDFERIGECDWIVEVVVENLDVKKQVMKRIAKHRKPGSIVSSNTSGIPIGAMSAHCPAEFQKYFLGTHFFNPVRYMKLLEIIPGPKTSKQVLAFMSEFGERVLGKGIVRCKDTPNFVANRIGVYGMLRTMHLMQELGYTIDEVDAISGPPMAHPRSASFRTADMAGVDTLVHVCDNVHASVPDDEARDTFLVPDFVRKMVADKRLGDKTGVGFYKKSKSETGERVTLTLDPASGEYKPAQKVRIDSLGVAKNLDDAGDRLRNTVYAEDRAGQFAWPLMRDTLVYSANRVPEIADSISEIDRAMRWGFNWDLGPFESWDAIGVKQSIDKMKAESVTVPAWVEEMVASGKDTFYVRRDGVRFAYDPAKKDYVAETVHPKIILLPSLKDRKKTVSENSSASLVDLGDGVLCLEFHSKMNAVDADLITLLNDSIDEVAKNHVGLVIANHDPSAFSAGANLMLIYMAAQQQLWADIEKLSGEFQQANMKLKCSPRPVVVAPAGLALGGGCEIVLHGPKVRAHGELYCGLVEVGVGLIPGAGGCKEMAVRATQGLPQGGLIAVDPAAFIVRAFEAIALAKVSSSAVEARGLGFLRASDGISLNRDHLIQDAKDEVLHMARMGYVPAQPRNDVVVGGEPVCAALIAAVQGMKRGGFASDHDLLIAKKVAYVVTGGPVPSGAKVSEQYLLDIEREAFLSLVGEQKSQDRIQHMLLKNKPLRN